MLFSSAIAKASLNSFAINNYANSIDFAADNDLSRACETATTCFQVERKSRKLNLGRIYSVIFQFNTIQFLSMKLSRGK